MSGFQLTEDETDAVIGIIQGDASDPIALIQSVGCDPKTFFMFGNWAFVDFRCSDLSGVSFLGSDITSAIFTPAQIDTVIATGPRLVGELQVIDRGKPAEHPHLDDGSSSNLDSKTHIQLIGSFRIVSGTGEDMTPSSAKGRALLALLAASPGYRRSRSWLQNMLWSHSDQSRAAGSLRQVLARIRQSFGENLELLHATRGELWLDSELISVDLDNPDPEVIAKMVGEPQVLEGMDVNEDEFEDWMRSLRSKFYGELKNSKTP